ncbi:MAG: hypothetical protein NTY38_10230 [Acidobacteria bacterium]|nr:hypothetical protein [Acidobacteriota bacterium]
MKGIGQALLRLLLAVEFLLAILVVCTAWSQVGGQYHLDLMAWYWKLLFVPAVAFATVRATMAAMAGERTWNAKTVAWLITTLALLAMMGAVTYYHHVYEPAEEEEMDTRTSLSGVSPVEVKLIMRSGDRRG